jgi:uncharacterized LabA/DUF88 family protein
MEKIAIFVDIQNIFYTVKEVYSSHFDYRYFWENVAQKRQIVKAIAYAIDKGDEKQINFQRILRKIGFEVKLKPYIQFRNGKSKGDWDVGIATDMLEYAQEANTIVLASGDGDFIDVVERIKDKLNTRIEVYGVPELTSMNLQRVADIFIPIDTNMLLPLPETW